MNIALAIIYSLIISVANVTSQYEGKDHNVIKTVLWHWKYNAQINTHPVCIHIQGQTIACVKRTTIVHGQTYWLFNESR